MRWESLGGGLFNPVAISSGPGRLTLTSRSSSNELILREWHDEAWSEARSLGIPLARAERSVITIPVDWRLAACSSGAPWPHLLARGPDGELFHCRGGEGGEQVSTSVWVRQRRWRRAGLPIQWAWTTLRALDVRARTE